MDKIIIENQTELTMAEVIRYVTHVVEGGRISGNNDHYCWVTTWTSGIVVSAFKNKKSDRFVIWMDKRSK